LSKLFLKGLHQIVDHYLEKSFFKFAEQITVSEANGSYYFIFSFQESLSIVEKLKIKKFLFLKT